MAPQPGKSFYSQIRMWEEVFSLEDHSLLKNEEKIAPLLNSWETIRPIVQQAIETQSDTHFYDRMQNFSKLAMDFFEVKEFKDLPKNKSDMVKILKVNKNYSLTESIRRSDLAATIERIIKKEKEELLLGVQKEKEEQESNRQAKLKAKTDKLEQAANDYFKKKEAEFLDAIKQHILNPLEKEREVTTGPHEIKLINDAIDGINLILINYSSKAQSYYDQKKPELNENIDLNTHYAGLLPMKKNCLNAIKVFARTNLIESPDLSGQLRSYGKKIGKIILNGLLIAPLGIPSLVKYIATGNAFFSLKTNVEKKGEEIVKSSKELKNKFTPKNE